jgi:peptide/nickel transport system substrate-binding protein
MKYNKLGAFFCIGIVFLMVGCQNKEALNPTETTKETVLSTTQPAIITPQTGGVLNVSIRNPKTLNPLLNEDESIDQFLNLLYDKLIVLDDQQKPVANIASSWGLSEDGKVLTLKIRSDIKWHNGNPLTAKDVVFSLDTIRKSATSSPYKACINNIASYSSNGDTVTINYSRPFSGYLYALSFPIISEKYYAGEDVLSSSKNMTPVGTGAYQFDSITTMKEITLHKNNSWFKGLPYIDSIHASIIPKEDAQLYAFNQGEIDLINTDVVDWEKYGVTKDRNIDEYTTNDYEFIGINFNKTLLNDKLVRQALAYAIPKQQIASEVYLDHVLITDTPINPKSWLNNKPIKYKLDIVKAKELLNQAGWTDSDGNGILDKAGQEFRFSLLVNQENSQRLQAAHVIQNALKAIGIEMSIDMQSFENYQQKLTTKSFDTFLGGWKLSMIPDYAFVFHSSNIAVGSNFGSYNNETMNILLEAAAGAVNEASMQQTYKNLVEYMTEELPYISLYFRNAAVLADGSVKGELNSDANNIYGGIKEWFIYKK